MAIGAMCRVRFLVTNRCRLIRWGKCTLATGDGNNGDHVWELCAFSAFSVSPCIFRLEVYWEKARLLGSGSAVPRPAAVLTACCRVPGCLCRAFLNQSRPWPRERREGRLGSRERRPAGRPGHGPPPGPLGAPPQLALHLGVLQRRHGNPVPACVPARTRKTCRGVSPSRRAVRTQPALRDSAPHSWRQSVGTSRPHWSPGEHLHL